jgi:hypothetical protein
MSITIKKYDVTEATIGLDGFWKSRAPIDEAAIVVEKKNSSPSFSNSDQFVFMLPTWINIKFSNSGNKAKTTLKKNHLMLDSASSIPQPLQKLVGQICLILIHDNINLISISPLIILNPAPPKILQLLDTETNR